GIRNTSEKLACRVHSCDAILLPSTGYRWHSQCCKCQCPMGRRRSRRRIQGFRRGEKVDKTRLYYWYCRDSTLLHHGPYDGHWCIFYGWLSISLEPMHSQVFRLAGVLAVVGFYGLVDPATGILPSCPFYTLTHWYCPGCGSQRALHALLHGDPGTA